MSEDTKDRPQLPQLPQKSEFSDEAIDVPDISDVVSAADAALAPTEDQYVRETPPKELQNYEMLSVPGSHRPSVEWFVRAMRKAQEARDYDGEALLYGILISAPSEFRDAAVEHDQAMMKKFRKMPHARRTPCPRCGDTNCYGSRVATIGT